MQKTEMNIKVAITDDHPMVIEGIRNILHPYKCIEIIATYQSGDALLKGLMQEQPDVLLLDIQMPDMDGKDISRIVSRQYSNLRILVVTSIENPYQMKEMMQNGCAGYILKNASGETLAKAIEQVHNGKLYMESSLKEELLQAMVQPTKKLNAAHRKDARLTKREQEILGFICEGLNNYEIADKLFLSYRTIQSHRMSLYEKLNVNNTATLVKKALQAGLI